MCIENNEILIDFYLKPYSSIENIIEQTGNFGIFSVFSVQSSIIYIKYYVKFSLTFIFVFLVNGSIQSGKWMATANLSVQ